MLQLYQQSINTGFTSIVCNWKKVKFHQLIEQNETVDLHIKFQRSGLFSWVALKVRICRLSFSEQNIKLRTKQYFHITLMWPCNTSTKNLKKRQDLDVLGFIYFELTKFKTVSFNETFRSCRICRNINNDTTVITTSLSIIMCANRKQLWIMGLVLLKSIHWHIQSPIAFRKIILSFMIYEF